MSQCGFKEPVHPLLVASEDVEVLEQIGLTINLGFLRPFEVAVGLWGVTGR